MSEVVANISIARVARIKGEYLVYCTQDGKTWTAYLVWASIKKIMGPYPPDPSIK